MGAGIPGQQITERIGDSSEVRLGDAEWESRAERVAQASGVFDCGPPDLSSHRHLNGSAVVPKPFE
jgi:hypothetical protein